MESIRESCLIIVDDPEADAEISEEEMRERLTRWFSTDFVSYKGEIYVSPGRKAEG